MHMKPAQRRALIQHLVRSRSLGTQAEVATALRDLGHDVVQTTVSRDIKELGFVKVRDEDGRLVYAEHGRAGHRDLDRLGEGFARWVHRCAPSNGLLVLFTRTGFASAVAEELDIVGHPLVLATLAGDNTVLVVPADGTSGRELLTELSPYLP